MKTQPDEYPKLNEVKIRIMQNGKMRPFVRGSRSGQIFKSIKEYNRKKEKHNYDN